MMFAAVRQYTYDPQHATEINQLVRERFAPKLREVPGFVAYYWMDTGEGMGTSWTVFEDEAFARASFDHITESFQSHVGLLLDPPQITQGQIVIFTNAGL